MPCCCPPRTTTEPISTLTRRFLTAASDPVVSWDQDPPSRDILDSCARLCVSKLSGASRASIPANPTTCSALFNSATSFSRLRPRIPFLIRLPFFSYPVCLQAYRKITTPSAPAGAVLVDLRQLRQHRSCLRLNIGTLILRSQRHQHAADTAVGLHRLNQPQRFNAYTRIRVIHQRAQDGVAHVGIGFYIGSQSVQRFQPHTGIGIVLQGIDESVANLRLTTLLRQQIDGIYAHS